MKSKEFDQLVRRSFEDARLPYNPENWQKLSADLDHKEQKRRRFLLWPTAAVAASVAIAIGVFALLRMGKEDSALPLAKTRPANTQQVAVQQPQPADNTTTEVPASVPEAPATPQAAHNTQGPRPQRTPEPVIVKQQKQQNIIGEPAPQQRISILPESPVIVNTMEPDPVIHRAEKTQDPVEVKKPVRSLAAITNPNTYYENVVPVRKDRKQFVTMAGGLNYGTLNSGYVMGFSAGTRLNETFYVEGDVAFVGNIANEKNQKTTFTPKASSPYARTTASSYASTVTVQRYYNLYYAQLTPTLGCKVARKMSVGLGADVQRLLINQVLITETDNPADSRELPVFDMGLVGKTEYNLTREIKASVYYRKGMNQALQGNSKMLDRDYLQLQLKFNILNK